MDAAADIPDPTDWLNTPLKNVSDFEATLHCQVCKDFFSTPMITTCCHSFCSLCIRRCLTDDGVCPACRAPDSVTKLRANPILEDLVQKFLIARPAMLTLATQALPQPDRAPRKRRRVVADSNYSGESSSTVESEPKRRRSKRGQDRQVVHQEAEMPEGWAACPICDERMKEEAVFNHLNVHNNEDQKPEVSSFHFNDSNLPTKDKRMERLPQINYSLLKEVALRKKMTELGVPSGGPRSLLIRRHTEWVNLVNANCDARKPRSKRELLRDLDLWDRTQGRQLPATSTKDLDSNAWAANHENDFKRLILEARQRSGQTKDFSVQPEITNSSQGGIQDPKTEDANSSESILIDD